MSELHGPAAGTIDAPTSNGAPPAGTIRLHPAGIQRPLPQPVSRSFRRNFLDRQDPFETAGDPIDGFTFSSSYELHGEPAEQVAEEIRSELVQQLVRGNLAEAEVEVIDFNDASQWKEPARRFIVTRTDTHRSTLLTVNAYVRSYGQHLYYSVRTYMLPPLSLWKLALGAVYTLLVLMLAGDVLRLVGIRSGLFAFLFGLAVVAFTYRRLIRNLLAGDDVLTALRKQFPARVDTGTFDNDDVVAFLKTNVALTLGTIAAVLQKHGINTQGIQAVIQNLHQHNHVNTGGGSIVGAAIGGIANRAFGVGR